MPGAPVDGKNISKIEKEIIKFALRYRPSGTGGPASAQPSKVWADDMVSVYKRNPVKFDSYCRGKCVKILGTVDNIQPSGRVVLRRNSICKKPRVVCEFETRSTVAGLDLKRQIIVSGKLDSIREVNQGPGRFYELRLVKCRRE